VVRIVDLTPTIKALHLRLDQSMRYQAGQYVQLRIPGLSEEQGGSRAFQSPTRLAPMAAPRKSSSMCAWCRAVRARAGCTSI
jgi:hypothetical protein